MRAVAVPSKGGGKPSRLTGPITNGFLDFARLWDDPWICPVGKNILDEEDFLASSDIVFVELIWKRSWQVQFLKFKQRHPDKPKFVCFTGSANRFYANCEPQDFSVHVEALEALDALGTMNCDMISHYSNFGNLRKVFHMPCVLNLDHYRQYADAERTKGRTTLCMHTDLFSTMGAKRCDAANLFLWKGISKRYPGQLHANTWVSGGEHRDSTRDNHVSREDMVESVSRTVKNMGIDNVDVRHAGRDFMDVASRSWLFLQLNFFHCQGRLSQLGAAIGVPVISPDMIETQRYLFPDLAVGWQDHELAMTRFDELWENEDFYRRVVEKARERVTYYSPEFSRKRIEKAVF